MDKLEAYLLQQGQIENTDNRLLRDVVYERLYQALKHVHLKAGDVLSEPRLAKAMGISRTPVREALHRLTQAGLLEVIPGRAIRVASPSIQHIFDALRVRKLLEPSMMQALAEQIAAEDLAQLQSITAEMEEAAHLGDRARWSRADNQWHELLSSACPNALLGEMVLQIRNRIFTTAADENVTDQYLIDGTAEHKDIVAAIQAGDDELAYQLAVRHIENLQADMSKRYNLPR